MGISRRRFLYSTGALAAGTCLNPAISLLSCQRSGKSVPVRMGYIGTEEQYSYYRAVFRKLKNAGVEQTTFDGAVISKFHALFLDTEPAVKSTQMILLLEQSKDIITPYPLAGSLDEYSRILDFQGRYGRIIGMLNPLHFYPSVRTLKNWFEEKKPEVSRIRVSCHPGLLVEDYPVSGDAGAFQPLQRLVSYLTGKFPVSLLVEGEGAVHVRQWMLDYDSFQAAFRADPGQTGWIMELEGPGLNALADHTGLLKLKNKVEPEISPDPNVWKESMVRNLQDFVEAVRFRKEPATNFLDGLSAIILTEAAGRSMQHGTRVKL